MKKPNRNVLFLSTMILVWIIALYVIFITVRYPYVGIELAKLPSGEWSVNTIRADSWAEANPGLISIGDIVARIDGRPPLTDTVGMASYLTVIHDGITYHYNIMPFDVGQTIVTHTLLPSFIFLIVSMISIVIYRKQSKKPEIGKETFLLIGFALSVALGYLGAGASTRGDLLSSVIVGFLLPVMPILLLHYLHALFARSGDKFVSFRVIQTGYVFVAANSIADLVLRITNMHQPLLSSLVSIMKLFVFILVNVLVLLNSIYKQDRCALQNKPILKIIVLGQMIAFFPFICLVALPRLAFGIDIIQADIAAVFVLAMPIMYLRLLTASRLLDIDYELKRLRYLGLLAFPPTFVIVLILCVIWHGTGYESVKWIQSFILVYAGIVAFLYFKESFDTKLRGRWFKETYNYQGSLERFTNRISKMMNTDDLEVALVEEIGNVLPVRTILLLETNGGEGNLDIKLTRGPAPPSVLMERLVRSVQDAKTGQFVLMERGTCYIYGVKGSKLQAIWFDDKINRTYLNLDESRWLKTLMAYVTIIHENLQLVHNFIGELEQNLLTHKQTPNWLLRLLFSISENERKRLSSDLHDSALQDQILWYRKLDSLLSQDQFPPQIRSGLERIRDGLLDVIEQIRETCNELRPPFLKEMGLTEAIDNLLNQMRLRTNYAIFFSAKQFSAKLDDHQVLTLYRIIQELLQNATKHSNATNVELLLSSTDDGIFVHYSDNGIGMDLHLLKSSYATMGLWGIRERVASLDGSVQFESEAGGGFRANIQVPIVISSPLTALDVKISQS